MDLRIERPSDQRLTVSIGGDLRDGADIELGRIVGQVDRPVVELDLAGVDAVNSAGVAAWVRFMGKLESKAKVEIQHVPAILAFFAGQMPNFFGKAKLLSFYVPHVCESCQKQGQVLLQAEAMAATRGLPDSPCGDCGNPMSPEFDVEGFLDVMLPLVERG